MKGKGVSLVETILVVLAIGFIVTLLANIPNSLNLITKSRHLSLAREIAEKQIEDERAISFANLTDGITPVVDPGLSDLPGGSGTITVEDCSSEICTNSEPIKHIVVTINWVDISKQQSVSLETLIGQGGISQ